MHIFVLEFPDPVDLLNKTSEMQILENICQPFDHPVQTFLIKNEREFRQTMDFISSYPEQKSHLKSIVAHLFGHGNEDRLGFANDFMSWKDLAGIVSETFRYLISYWPLKLPLRSILNISA